MTPVNLTLAAVAALAAAGAARRGGVNRGDVVTDEDGDPLVVYHGTRSKFDVFSPAQRGRNWDDDASKIGFFFTSDEEDAHFFATKTGGDGTPLVLAAHLFMSNPVEIYSDDVSRYTRDWLSDLEWDDPGEYEFQTSTKAYENSSSIHKGLELAIVDAFERGRDGVVYTPDWGPTWYVVFNPSQVKVIQP